MKKPRRRKRRSNPYRFIPLTSLFIFLTCFLLIKGGRSGVFTPADSKSEDFPASLDLVREVPDISPPDEAAMNIPDVKDVSITKSDSDTNVGVFINNSSSLDISIDDFLNGDLPVELTEKGVQVLIVHTHGSESYTPTAENYYEYTENDRTTDTRYNVVRVGDEIEKILNERGIPTVHVREIFDSPTYSGSYTRSLEAISNAMKENPSIKIVIDVHRDAIIAKDGTKYKTVAEIDGKTAAQLMFVTGTSGGGLSHDNWQKNLSFHAMIHREMNKRYPGIMRPISIRDSRFNQHVSTGSMLLEVGSSGNTLEEAIYSASLFADTLADMLFISG